MDCPSLERLLEAALLPTPPDPVLAHLDGGCPTCVARWRVLCALPGELTRQVPEDPPAHLVREARALGRGLLGRLADRAREVLLLGAGEQPALAPGLRGAAATCERLYVTDAQDGSSFELTLEGSAPGPLHGQLFPLPGDGPATCLLFGPDEHQEVPLDEFGEFEFPEVPPGVHQLAILVGERSLLLEDLDLRHPGS